MCGNCENNIDFSKLDLVLDEYGQAKGSLIAILQKAQDIYGYLPPQAIRRIAGRTGIKPAKIMGVVTFYTQFRLKPVGKNLILLCQGTACHVLGSAAIEETILSFLSGAGGRLKEGEISADGLFTVQSVACLGCCSLAPVMMINGETFGLLTPDKTRQILQGIIDAEKKAQAAATDSRA
ncbi:MAG: NAD(P)H-dependent oxidoreductase subunit E [Spirochaetes bacterium]|nr:NAD(P)H-dependent oxidoreductase subunit E [Spirochaetota bacterium]